MGDMNHLAMVRVTPGTGAWSMRLRQGGGSRRGRRSREPQRSPQQVQ